MKQNRIIIGVVAVVALAVIGVILLTGPEPQPPATAPGPATVAVPPPADGEDTQPAAPEPPATPPAEPAQAVDTGQSDMAKPETAEPAPAEPAQAGAPAPEREAPAQVAAVPEAAEAEAAAETAQQPPSGAPTTSVAKPLPPSFDVVRVERSGEAVIAGRAGPGSEVTLRADGRALGKVTADGRGQWVLVLETPLAPGSHELSLESRGAGDEVLLSENVVVVSVPQPQIAAKPPEPAAEPAVEPTREPAPETTQPDTTQEAARTPEPAPEPTVQAAPEPSTAESAVADQAIRPAPSEATGTQVAATEPAATAQPAPEAEQPLAVLMPRSGEGRIRILQQAESAAGGLGEGTLILETVDYDAQGRTEVGGRAEAGSRLIVYLDNKLAANARADADGHWQATLAKSIAPGLHRLRVDQLDADGQVQARVETPFSRAAVVAALPSESAVIVQPGNSLWRISRRIYGEGMRYSVIYQANQEQIRDPDLIYPGQIFVVPSTN